jgi:hypothetical protein
MSGGVNLESTLRRSAYKKSAATFPLKGDGVRRVGVVQLLEQFHRIDERLQHTEGEWNADKPPSDHKLQRRRACMIFTCHEFLLPYALAGLPLSRAAIAAPASAAVASAVSPSGFMWKRAWTALTNTLQMKPITNNPAMMYMVTL